MLLLELSETVAETGEKFWPLRPVGKCTNSASAFEGRHAPHLIAEGIAAIPAFVVHAKAFCEYLNFAPPPSDPHRTTGY